LKIGGEAGVNIASGAVSVEFAVRLSWKST
jgi:hypothetical protein